MQLTRLNLWARLTTPHRSLIDIEERRQSTLLSGFILVFLAISLLSLINASYTDPARAPVSGELLILALLVHTPFALLAYYLNRVGHYKESAILYISTIFFILHATLPMQSATLGFMFFDSALLLMGSMLLSTRESIMLAAASLTWQILIALVAPKATLVHTSGAVLINLAVAALGLIFVQHRTHVERERRAELESAYAALHESEEKFRTIFEAAPYAITMTTLDTRFIAVNETFLNIAGLTRDQVLGRNPIEIGLVRDSSVMERLTAHMRTEGQITNFELDAHHADGRPLKLLYSSRFLNLGGEQCVIIFGTDLTERNRVEQALVKERQLLRTVIDHLPDNIFVKDTDSKFVLNNAESLRILGATRQEDVLGKSDVDFFTPEQATEWRAHEQVIMQGGKAILDVEVSQPWRVDRRRWVIESAIPMHDERGEVIGLVGINRDITERKLLEAELQRHTGQLELIVEERTTQLRRTKEQLEAILNNVGDGIALVQRHGDIQATNPAFRALFGNRTDAAIEDILRSVSEPDQMEAVAEALVLAIFEHQNTSVEARIRNVGGQYLDVELDVFTLEEAELSSILLSVHDITHLKELERFNARFVANAVHDLSNPITAVSTRLYLLQRTPEKLVEHTRILQRQVERLRDLVSDLRSLSAIEEGSVTLELEPTNLNDLVAQIIETCAPVCTERRQLLMFVPHPDLPMTLLDRRKCERVAVNLISNAINYTPEGGEIRVLTQLDGDSVVLTVQDQGIGIGSEDLPHIFERFYRADKARKTHDSGTGLGLAIVKEIVEAHGGVVSAESELNRGSRFAVRFPQKTA